MSNTYQLTSEVRDGLLVGVFIQGQASIDETLDAMRGFMVACGYHPDTAKRLDVVEPDGAQE